ncbi:tRNA lysidine(34) synthetase TilS [Tellurirhabdus rosea]|uniref:tRNA lysidine(34) synthetase TilS n=1 Tax=Tellurirhabdus rosea TaxID=2674997 RepID=UPI00224D57C7|nr:tRNA lysidine(34) synthetase TilS [Tellurirhabdus rosea]
MRDEFLTFVNEQHLFGPTDSVLLAVSGGIDSVVMVDLFQQQAFTYGIAHVNFGLRGEESDEDEVFVRQLAEKNGVRFHSVRFNTRDYAAQEGISIQMAARQLRYHWFEEVAQTAGYPYIATAHHQDDSLETLLLNLVRGTGLAGLTGIRLRNGRVIRPLLFAERLQIETYAAAHGLTWREDRSNAEDKYARNRLRHQVVPVLKGLNVNLLNTVKQTFDSARASGNLVRDELARSWPLVSRERGGTTAISVSDLLALPEWEFRLGEWLKPYGFRPGQLPALVDAVKGTNFGQVFESPEYRLLRDRTELILSKKTAGPGEVIVLPGMPDDEVRLGDGRVLQFEIFQYSPDFQIKEGEAVVCLDAARMEWPLTIRLWQTGDRFRPLGLKGSQKVSDFLTNRKVSRREREEARVLLSGGRIVWLIGYRPDDFYRLTPETKQVLQISLKTR